MKYLLSIKNDLDLQLAGLLVIFYISEGLTKYFILTGATFHNYSALVKGIFSLFVVIFAVLNTTRKRKSLLFFFIAFILIFLIGQYKFNLQTLGTYITQNIKFAVRYLFVFIILLYFTKLPYKFGKGTYFKVYEKIVLFNSLLIIAGFFFDIQLFKTYKFLRFGYSGFFAVPSLTSYFYALALTYFSYHYITNNTKKLELTFVLLVSMIAGTKALMLFVLLTLIHLLIVKKIYKKKWFLVGLPMLIGILYLLRNTLSQFIKARYQVLYDFYKENDLVTMLTSGRNLKLNDNFIPLIKEKWDFINYLFGGTDFVTYRVEFELLDLILFWGIIGSIVYLVFYFYSIIRFSKIIFFGKIQTIFLLLIVLLSGNFFHNASTALYLLVVLSSLTLEKHRWQ